MSGATTIKYRADIDGLRAVAVLAVLVYHLGFRPAPGGFIGVDVFFVISGYLIGSLVFAQAEAGAFSFTSFYVRRIRRLFPALFAVLAVTSAAAAWILLPDLLREYGESLASAAGSVSNFYFWLTSDYFDGPAADKPLLHTWSLAVEEQFYLLFPPLAVWLTARARKHATLILSLIALVSLAWSAIGAFTAPTSTFYLPHTRAWELLLGVLLARNALPEIKSAALRNGATLLGLALIAVSVLLISEETPFPGLAALPPCLGTALIIHAGRSGASFVSALLSWRPVVFVGLISYSLYLWHWPLIVLYEQYKGVRFLEMTQKLEVAALSFALATLSWYFIERPFRRGKAPPSRVFYWAGASGAALVASGALVVAFNGLPQRFSPEVVRLASYIDYKATADEMASACFVQASQGGFERFEPDRCLAESADRNNMLLLGDSHSAHLARGLRSEFPEYNLLQANASDCKPLLQHDLRASPGCVRLYDFIFDEFLPTHRVNTVIVAARWAAEDLPEVGALVDSLKALGVRVVLVGPIVQYDGGLPALLSMAAMRHDPALPGRKRLAWVPALDAAFARLAAEKGVVYASAYQAICPSEEGCVFTVQGVPVQHDYGHLTIEGSQFVARRFREMGALGELHARAAEGAKPL